MEMEMEFLTCTTCTAHHHRHLIVLITKARSGGVDVQRNFFNEPVDGNNWTNTTDNHHEPRLLDRGSSPYQPSWVRVSWSHKCFSGSSVRMGSESEYWCYQLDSWAIIDFRGFVFVSSAVRVSTVENNLKHGALAINTSGHKHLAGLAPHFSTSGSLEIGNLPP